MPLEPTELIEFLAPYPPEIQALTLDARLRLHELVGPASDLFSMPHRPSVSGFSYTGEPRDNFLNLAVYAKHVSLIFPWGVNLPDPERRLRGEGNQVRNLRLTGMEVLQDPYVLDLIRLASQNAVRPAEPVEPVKYVKIYAGAKRRPTH